MNPDVDVKNERGIGSLIRDSTQDSLGSCSRQAAWLRGGLHGKYNSLSPPSVPGNVPEVDPHLRREFRVFPNPH